METEIGFVILAHRNLNRTAQLSRVLADGGARVVIHVDARCDDVQFQMLRAQIGAHPGIRLVGRIECDWGMYSLVRATLASVALLIDTWPGVAMVANLSGDTLPIRPVAAILAHISANADSDMIGSVPVETGEWIKGGLREERLRYWFPLGWRRHRWLFDRLVLVQRALGIRRRVPAGLSPRFGSQFWCLRRQTLQAILDDPDRDRFERFFKWTWIPDESYFQTLAARHSDRIVPDCLVFAEFDHSGTPVVFHDDHADLLSATNALFVRKVWPGAEELYSQFLAQDRKSGSEAPDFGGLRERIALVEQQRLQGIQGKPGLGSGAGKSGPGGTSAGPYDLVGGFDAVFPDFAAWADGIASGYNGRLFGTNGLQLGNGRQAGPGCLPLSTAVRDFEPVQYLQNLIWATRGRRQLLLFQPHDNAAIASFAITDPLAAIHFIKGAWALELFASGHPPGQLARRAANRQAIERKFLNQANSRHARADIRIWTLDEVLQAPDIALNHLYARLGGRPGDPRFARPSLRPIDGFAEFMAGLRALGVPD